MEIIHKFIPKNPITSQTMEKITNKAKDVLKVFGEYYLKQTQLVIVRNKEDEYERKEIRKAIVKKDKEKKEKYFKKKFGEDSDVPNFPEIPEKGVPLDVMTDYCTRMLNLGFKPLFPRGKMEPLKPPELKVKITRYIIRDREYDPYAVYVIQSFKGNFAAEKERRFKEFEKLHKALKKIIPKEIALPPASSKIGVRNLSEEFLTKRISDLDAYLQSICAIEAVQNHEAFQKFIGMFVSDDPLGDQIFDVAYRKTRYYFWCWFDAKFDDPGDAMSKLLTRAIWRSVSGDIYSACPTAEAPRRASIKLAYKLIAGVIDPLIPPAWNAAYEGSKKARVAATSALETLLGIIIEKKNDINNQLKDKMLESFTPIKDALGKLFSEAVHKAVPPIIEPFSFIYKTYKEKSEPLILESFKDCDEEKLKQAVDILNKIHEDIVAKLNEKVDEQLQIICEDLKGAVSFTLLHDCFNPMKAIGKIIADFVRIINPKHWSKVASTMFEYKTRLSKCDGIGVDKILIEMERSALYYMSWESWYMDNGRYALRYDIYHLGLDLDAIADVCFNLGRKLIKKVYKKSCKKFIRKFSDYVWGFSQKKEDDKPWNEKVDEAFMIAYNAAKHKFNKECGNIVKCCVSDILGGVIVNKVIEEVKKAIGELMKTLTSIIPDNIKEMVDIEEMAQNDIEEVLTQTFEGAIDAQDEAFSEELNLAIEKCQI